MSCPIPDSVANCNTTDRYVGTAVPSGEECNWLWSQGGWWTLPLMHNCLL